MEELGLTTGAVISLVVYWWMGKTDDISIVGNVNPTNVHIGEDVILSCQVRNCRSPILTVHLYKWEGSANKTVYIHQNTTQPSIRGSNSEERDKNRIQKGMYINGYLEVTLIMVKAADAGKYVCALTCGHVYKEDTIEMIPWGLINASVGEDIILPGPLIAEHELFYLKMQWKRISPGKRQTIYSYLFQNTSRVVCSEDTLGHRCTSSNGPSTRVWLGKKYRQKAEVFKGNEFRDKTGYLKLKNVLEEDAGTYVYSVRSNLLHKEVTFQLSVKGIQDQDPDISISHSSMYIYLLCLLLLGLSFAKGSGTLFAAHMCLCKGVHGTDLRDCNITGELPAPQIFLNVSEAQEGDSVLVRCTLSSNFSVTVYFFCKDEEAKSAYKAMPHDSAYTWAFPISKQSAGHYSCGYKLKDNKNQEKKSALSASWKLTVLPGNHAQSGDNGAIIGQIIPLYVWILRTAVVLLLLFSGPIFNYFLRN